MRFLIQSTSSMVGPPAPPAPPAPAPPAPPGIPPGMPPGAPPACWYNFVMIGLQTPSTSFCLSWNSSTSASWFASSHLMISSHFLVMVSLSDSLILSLSFSSSRVDFMLKQYDSKLFLALMRSFCFSSSALNVSASLTILSISVQVVLGADAFLLFLILGLECFGIVNHSLNFLLRQPTLVVGDCDLVLFSRGFVHCRYVQDTVGVNVKSNFNLRNTTRCWWNSSQIKFSKQVVVFGHCSFSFIDLNGYGRLIVRIGCKGLGLFGWDGGVSFDQGCHNSSGSFNTKRKWGDVQKQKIADSFTSISSQDSSLYSCSIGNSLIGVDGFIEFLSIEEIGQQFLDLWNSSRSTNQDDIID